MLACQIFSELHLFIYFSKNTLVIINNHFLHIMLNPKVTDITNAQW